MASAIDITKPVSGSATTQSVRDNFATAKTEIEALQNDLTFSGGLTVPGEGLFDPGPLKVRNSDTGNAELILYDTTDGGFTFFSQDGVLRIGEVNTSGVWVENFIAVDQAGNVGIGVTTPGERLDINGHLDFDSSNPTSYIDTRTKGLHFDLGSEVEWLNSISGAGYGFRLYGTDPGGGTDLNLDVRAASATWTQFLRIQDNREFYFINDGVNSQPIVVTDGTTTLSLNPNQSAGGTNPISQAGDVGIFAADGAINTGKLVIAPWSSTAVGIRMEGLTDTVVIRGDVTTDGKIIMEGAASFADLTLDSTVNSAAQAIGVVNFQARDSAAGSDIYGRMLGIIVDPTSTSEDGSIRFDTEQAGSLTPALVIEQGVYTPSATGGDQGAGTINVSSGYYVNGVQADLATSGSFLPELWDNSYSGSEGQTYLSRSGEYTKIGNWVFITASMAMSSLGTLSTASQAYIGNLPFTSVSSFPTGGFTINQASGLSLGATDRSVTAFVVANADYAGLYNWGPTTGSATMSISEVSSTGDMKFFGMYRAA